MKRACEGYCGGYVDVEDVHTTSSGERFCRMCYSELKRQKHYENDG